MACRTLVLAFCLCAGLAAAQAQDDFCVGAAEPGTGQPGFWVMLAEDAELPFEVRNATLAAAKERWVACDDADLTSETAGCSLVEQEGGAQQWQLRINATCNGPEFIDAASFEALVSLAEGGEPQVNITDAALDMDPARTGGGEVITVPQGAALAARGPGGGSLTEAGCGFGRYLRPDPVAPYCTDCTRTGCLDCRACMPGVDGPIDCVDFQYCFAPCAWGYYIQGGSCIECNPNCLDCQPCQEEPGCMNGFCTTCIDGYKPNAAGICARGNTCPEGCATCSGNVCQSCVAGWYNNGNGRCFHCDSVPNLVGCATCSVCTGPDAQSQWCYQGSNVKVKCMGCTPPCVPAGDGTQTCRCPTNKSG